MALRRPGTALAALAACLVLALPAQAAAAPCANGGARAGDASADRLAKASVCVLNKVRARRGLRKLRLNGRLSAAARRHTSDMVRHDFFGHVSRRSGSVVNRLSRTGYMRGARSWTIGENLAWGTGGRSTPVQIVRAWLRSPGHRANMLSSRFREIGVGVALEAPGHSSRPGATYTHTFGARR